MADLFSLAPEGQAWTDDDAANNPARPDDYDPSFFSGSLSALPRGVAEGTIGLAQSGVAASKKLISDPAIMQQFIPTYGAFKALFPDADQRLNETYDATSKALTAAQADIKPTAGSQGIAAQTLEGLGQFAPAMLATVAAGPLAGGAVAAGSTFEPARQEFMARGVDAETAEKLATEESLAGAAGMALPAGIGGRLLTRLASGVAINTGFGAANRFAVGDTLEDNGYTDLAQQYRVWDKQALLVDGVLGAAFGGLHHFASGRNAPVDEAVSTNFRENPDLSTAEIRENPETSTNDQPLPTESPASAPESGIVAPENTDSVSPASTTEPASAQTYEGRVSELQDLAGQLMSRGDRQALAAEIHSAERALSSIEAQRQALRESSATTSSARRIRNRDIAALDNQIEPARVSLEQQRAQLAEHSRGGRFFEAKADLSRLQQGIVPESMRGLVPEAEIKPSDIDAAHALNEGLNYDIESAPILHGDLESLNSHVAAMDTAGDQLMRGEPVNVDQQVKGLNGIPKPDALEAGQEQHAAMERAFQDNGIATSPPRDENINLEPPIKDGMVRVYHSGSVGEGETGRWVSTNRTYSSDYRGDLPLHYFDVPADDPRVNNPDYPDQGVGNGFTFIFELSPEEAAKLRVIDRVTSGPDIRSKSAFSTAGDSAPDQTSTDPDTGEVISSNSYDLMAARDMSQTNPDMEIIDPDTGQLVKLSDALAGLDEQIATTQKESRAYSVAAACFLRNS